MRTTAWDLLRTLLSPRLAELNRDAFVIEDAAQSTVDLDAHRGDSSLSALDLGAEEDIEAS